jgi:hypothetical protein
VLGRSEPSQEATAGPPAPAAAPDPDEAANIVAQYRAMRTGWVIVYADGRVIGESYFIGPPSLGPGIVERRLTPAGLELVRSGEVKPSTFLTQSTVSQPAGAFWADAEFKPYAPSRYAVWFSGWGALGPPGPPPSANLPTAAQTMLHGKERIQDIAAVHKEMCSPAIATSDPGQRRRYFALSSEEASTLRNTLIDEGWFVANSSGTTAEIRAPGEPTWAETEFTGHFGPHMWQHPILPHGELITIDCG